MAQGRWCLLFVVVAVVPAAAQVDQARAEQYFKEAQALCERDGGRLWGVSLCGPNGDRGRRHWDDRHEPAGAGW